MRVLAKIFVLLLRPKVRGRENLEISGNTIIICNHLKLRDPVILMALFKRQIHFIAKVELFKTWFLRNFLLKMGTFPVNRGGSDIKAIRTGLNILKEGGVLGVFPEGTRSRTGELGPFEPGIALFALKTGAKVVPVVIHNQYSFFKRPLITIGAPINFISANGNRRNSELVSKTAKHFYDCVKQIKDQSWGETKNANTGC